METKTIGVSLFILGGYCFTLCLFVFLNIYIPFLSNLVNIIRENKDTFWIFLLLGIWCFMGGFSLFRGKKWGSGVALVTICIMLYYSLTSLLYIFTHSGHFISYMVSLILFSVQVMIFLWIIMSLSTKRIDEDHPDEPVLN